MEINDSTYQDILNQNKILLIIFSSFNYGYCKIAKNNLRRVIDDFPDLDVYEYNIDNNSLLFEKYNINGVPTMILFKNKKMVHRFFGIREASDLYYQLKSYLPVMMITAGLMIKILNFLYLI